MAMAREEDMLVALLRLLCILLLSTPSSSCDGIKSRLVEGFATEDTFVGLLMVSFESRCLVILSGIDGSHGHSLAYQKDTIEQ